MLSDLLSRVAALDPADVLEAQETERRRQEQHRALIESASHDYWLYVHWKYGLTRKQYIVLWESQRGSCPVCGWELPAPRKCAVDHDHRTGKVRGILHIRCNAGLGMLGDTSQTLRWAFEYLERSDAKG